MMKTINILITAASRRVAMVESFKRAVNRKGYTGKIVAADTNPNSPALYFTDKHYIVPLSSSSDYIPAIEDICKKENISMIVPTIDEELPIFGQVKRDFEKIGVVVLTSEKETGDICLDKYKTYNFFKKNGIPFASTLLKNEVDIDRIEYPLFIKPRHGRGSINAFPIKNKKELLFFMDYIPSPVIQPYLEGREFTIDVLTDLKGKVVSVVPRERLVIRSGVCDRGMTVKDKILIDYGVMIAETLKIIGPSNFQCKMYNNCITFFEVNPRFSGAIQLTIAAGANFPQMIVEMLSGNNVKPVIGDFQDMLTMISYENSIYRGKDDVEPHLIT